MAKAKKATSKTKKTTATKKTTSRKKATGLAAELLKLKKAATVADAADTVQANINQSMLSDLQSMLKKADNAYFETEIGKALLFEYTDSLQRDLPDQRRLAGMLNIMNHAAGLPKGEWTSTSPLYLIKLMRRLCTEEIVIIQTAYALLREYQMTSNRHVFYDAIGWNRVIAEASGGQLADAVISFYENHLVSEQLIGGRAAADHSSVSNREQYRLTPFGVELGSFLFSAAK